MPNPIDKLKGVSTEPPLMTNPTPIAPDPTPPSTITNATQPIDPGVYSREAGIDPSLSQDVPASEIVAPDVPKAPPTAELPAVPTTPNVAPTTEVGGVSNLLAPPMALDSAPAPTYSAPSLPAGGVYNAKVAAPVYAAGKQNAQILAESSKQGAFNAPEFQDNWSPPDLGASLSNFGVNAEALRESFKIQAAQRQQQSERDWLNQNLAAIEAMAKPQNSATGNGMSWISELLGNTTSEDGPRQYVNIVKFNKEQGEWKGSGIGAVLYGLGLAQNSVVGGVLDAMQLYRNVDKGISEAYNRYTPPWLKGSTDTALKALGVLLPQAPLFRSMALKENRYYDGRSNLVEALRGAQYSFSDESGKGLGIKQNFGVGTIATWNPNYGKPGQSMFIDTKVDINPSVIAGVGLDVLTGAWIDGGLGKAAAKLGMKPGVISKATGLTAAGLDGSKSFVQRGGKVGSNPRAVTPAQQAEAAAARAAAADRSPVQLNIPFLTGPVLSSPVVPPQVPKGMRASTPRAPRSPIDRGKAVQLELPIREMMGGRSGPSAGELAVQPDAYKAGLRGRKGKDGGGQLEMRLGDIAKTKPEKLPPLENPASIAKPPLQFKFDPYNPGELGARGFEPKNSKVAMSGTQFELPLGKAGQSTPLPKEPKVPKVPVKLDSTVEQLGFDPFNPGELAARGYEPANLKKTQYINKKTGNQLTLSVPVEQVPVTPQIPFSTSIKKPAYGGKQLRIDYNKPAASFDVMPEAFAPTVKAANPAVLNSGEAVAKARVATIEAAGNLDPMTVPVAKIAQRADDAGLNVTRHLDDVASLRKEYDVLSKRLDRATEKTMEGIVTRMGEIETQMKQLVTPKPSALDELVDASIEGRRLNREGADVSLSLDEASAAFSQTLDQGYSGRKMLYKPSQDTVPYPPRDASTPVSRTRNINPFKEGDSVYHGTQVKDYPISDMNPLDGAASSEMGLGIYTTPNEEVAKYAAKATRNADVPMLPSRPPTDGSGQVREITNIHDLHIVSGSDTNPEFAAMATEVVDESNGRFRAIFDAGEEHDGDSIISIFSDANRAFSDPDLLRDFQRAFTQKMLDDGIDGAMVGKNLVIYRTAGVNDLGPVMQTAAEPAREALKARYVLNQWGTKQIDAAPAGYLNVITHQSNTARHAQSLHDIELLKEAAADKAFKAVERSGLMDNPNRIPTLDEFVRLGVSDTTDGPSLFNNMSYGAEHPELIKAFMDYAERRGVKVMITDPNVGVTSGAAGTMNSYLGQLKISPKYENSLNIMLHEIGHDIIEGTVNPRRLTTQNEMIVETAAQVVVNMINPKQARSSQGKLSWFFEQIQPGGAYDKVPNNLTVMTREEFIKSEGELVVKLVHKLIEEIAPGIKVPPIKSSSIFTPEAFTQYIDNLTIDHGSKSLSSLLKKSYVTIENADTPTLQMVERFATNPATGAVNNNAVELILARYGSDVAPVALPKEMPKKVFYAVNVVAAKKGKEEMMAALKKYVAGEPIEDFGVFGPKVKAIMDDLPTQYANKVVVNDFTSYPVKLQSLLDNYTAEADAVEYALKLSRGEDPYTVLGDLSRKYPEIDAKVVDAARRDIDDYLQMVNCQ